MIRQVEQFLNKAKKLLAEGDIMLRAELYEAAGRTAYLAAFHAAQALIFEKTGRVSKTHEGVNRELSRLTKDIPNRSPLLRSFLSQSYNFKATADYSTDAEAELSPERAIRAMAEAKEFLAEILRLIQ